MYMVYNAFYRSVNRATETPDCGDNNACGHVRLVIVVLKVDGV